MRHEPNVGRRMAVGAAWMVMLRFAVRGLGLINTVVLARLLAPEDFGLVAIGLLLYSIVDMLTGFNFEVPLIADRSSGPEHFNTAWTLTIVKGVVTAIVLSVLASTAAG